MTYGPPDGYHFPPPPPPAANPATRPESGSVPPHPHIPAPRQPAPPPPMAPGPPSTPPGYPPAPPRRSRRRAITVTVACLVLTLLAATTLAGTAWLVGPPAAHMRDGAIPSPEDGDPPGVREEYLLHRAEAKLAESAQGLLDGDEAAWLELYDSNLHDDLRRRFEALRAMEVSRFDYQVLSDEPEKAGGEGEYNLDIAANYCMGGERGDDCAPTSIVFSSKWRDAGDEFTVTAVEESKELGPRPWEIEDLEAVAGERAIVAAPQQYSDQLEEALPIAEEAAANADDYARWGEVDKYIVYLAGDAEFSSWYGIGNPGDNIVGFAIPLPEVDDDGEIVPGGSEVVMHADRLGDDEEFVSTMRHELGHVATLHHSPEHHQRPEEWWVSEGLAELIDHGPQRPLNGYVRRGDVEAYFDETDWNGKLESVDGGDDPLAGSAKYGIAFYAMYYLWEEYGEEQAMEFFNLVAREGEEAGDASGEVFDKPYSDIEDEAANFVEKTVA